VRIFRKLAQMLDVNLSGLSDGDALVWDEGTEKWVPGAGGGGGGAPTDATYITQTANAGLDSEQALSALATGLVKVTNGTGVLSTATGGTDYANASHQHAGEDITSGTVADARIASTIARDSEVTSAISALSSVYQAKDTTLDTYAGIDPSANVQSVLGAADYAAIRTLLGLVIGTNVQAFDADLSTWAGLTPSAFFQTLVDDADAATARTTLGVIASLFQNGGAQEISIAGLDGTPTELTNHLNDSSDAHDASAISVLDTAANFTGTDVEAVLAELQDNIDAGGGGSVDPEDMNLIVAMEVFA